MPDHRPSRAPPPNWLWIALSAVTVLLLAWCWSRVFSRLGADRNTDFADYYSAAKAMAAGGDPYTTHLGRFIYPPLLAVLLVPLSALPLASATVVWSVFNVGSVVLLLWISARTAIRRFAAPVDRTTTAAVVLVTLLLAIEPVRWVIELGNCDGFMGLALVLAILWSGRRAGLCGMAIGLAANVKYQSLIALPYVVVRRRWREVAAIVAWTAGLMLLPALFLGWRRNLEYLGVALSGFLRLVGIESSGQSAGIQDVTYHRSVSLTSAAARLVEALALPQAVVLLLVALAGLGCLGIAWAIYRRSGLWLWRSGGAERGAAVELLEWCGLIVAVLVFSPQTTTRHMLLVIPLHAVVTVLVLNSRQGAGRVALVVGAVLFQLGTRLPPQGAAFERALDVWRSIGGASWCLLAMFFAALWTGIGARPGAGQDPSRRSTQE